MVFQTPNSWVDIIKCRQIVYAMAFHQALSAAHSKWLLCNGWRRISSTKQAYAGKMWLPDGMVSKVRPLPTLRTIMSRFMVVTR